MKEAGSCEEGRIPPNWITTVRFPRRPIAILNGETMPEGAAELYKAYWDIAQQRPPDEIPKGALNIGEQFRRLTGFHPREVREALGVFQAELDKNE